MNKYNIILIPLVLLIGSLWSCSVGGNRQLRQSVDSFSVAYFNWRFVDATPYVTHESQRWLGFVSSQVMQEDVDTLRNMANGAKVNIEDISETSDSTAEATVKVSNFLAMDSIDGKKHIITEKQFTLPLVFRNDKWLVNLTALP